MSETPIYDANKKLLGWIKDNRVIYLPESKSSTPYIDSLNRKPESPADKIQKKKWLTSLLGGAFD